MTDPMRSALKEWGQAEIEDAMVRATGPMLRLKARLNRKDAGLGRARAVERATLALVAAGLLIALASIPDGIRWGSPVVLVALLGALGLLGASLGAFFEN